MIIDGDDFASVLKKAQSMYDFQKRKGDETVPKIMKVELCKGVEFHSSSLDVKDSWGSRKEPTTVDGWNRALEAFDSEVDGKVQAINQTHAANAEAIASNEAVVSKVSLIMRELGIPGTYQERDYSSRAQRPKYNTNPAGYIGDLRRNVVTSDGFDSAMRSAANAKQQAKEYHAKKIAGLAQREREEAAAKKKIKDDALIVHMRVKYKCDVEDTVYDVLRAIIGKNKYLWLAHWMHENRLNWIDGHDSASVGLNGFTVETEEDQKIYDAVNSRIENWDGDGRCFRDMDYSYDVIYGMVEDEELMADYQRIAEVYSDFR